ncbi:DUF1615 domain-containing protein [Pseudaquabacterium rugosum]|uniref:DUF1615 domain-containing protein n=1 Tax=Pseudaquabacterium rugosum TaxID=2984194 RepID=A0ABU9BCP2_9BURK
MVLKPCLSSVARCGSLSSPRRPSASILSGALAAVLLAGCSAVPKGPAPVEQRRLPAADGSGAASASTPVPRAPEVAASPAGQAARPPAAAGAGSASPAGGLGSGPVPAALPLRTPPRPEAAASAASASATPAASAAPVLPPPAMPVPMPVPPDAPPVRTADVRAVALRVLPPRIGERNGWADDIATSFAALRIPAQAHKVCAISAVIEQESGWQADPPVTGLARIARRELEKKRAAYGIPQPVFALALKKTSPDGRSYERRLDTLRTERELSALYEDIVSEIPFGERLLDGGNPVRTGGSTQVSIAWAAQHMRERPYPWPRAGTARQEVFKRRGGVYFGASMLLDYPVSYQRMIYRFADFNAGRYASRNAAVQVLLSRLTGGRLEPDGDLLRYAKGQPLSPRRSPSEAWTALLSLRPALGLSESRLEADLMLEKSHAFERTATYERLYALAAQRNVPAERERLPDIALDSPKITRKLTTAWFADRVEMRYRACLARDAAASAVAQPPGDAAGAPGALPRLPAP